MNARSEKIIVLLVTGVIMMSVFTGCSFKKYTVTADDAILTGLGEYRKGAAVKLVQEIWASDTDYSFFVDGEPADVYFDNDLGYVITFTMPGHDVHVTCETRNTTCVEVP